MDEKKVGRRPSREELSPKHTQFGRKWIPLHGPYIGRRGEECCATSDFEWVGLAFPGERGYHVFNFDDLGAAD
jgi:hypothetical protein